jgi:uncharacterized protein YabN with tetrapyrrole methylase and pyrophosphatase domain
MLNQNEEDFVQNLISGMKQWEAYLAAYPNKEKTSKKVLQVRACELKKRTDVKERIEELRREIAKESKYTVEKLIEEFEEIRIACMRKNNHGNIDSAGACRATENKGKLLGYYTEKIQTDTTVKIVIEGDVEEWAQ